jgi:hypothetical protein
MDRSAVEADYMDRSAVEAGREQKDACGTEALIQTFVLFDTGQELLNFEREHGHCNVPQKYSLNPSLGAWVAQQRRRYK